MTFNSQIRLYQGNSDPTRGLLQFQAESNSPPLSEKERMDEIAIRFLKDEEKKDVLAKGRRSGILGWIESFFWKPIKVTDLDGEEHVVLVNINSAIERLGVLGFDSEKIKKNLAKKDPSSFARNVAKEINSNVKLILRNEAKKLKKFPSKSDEVLDVLVNKINSKELTLEECKDVFKYAIDNKKNIDTISDFNDVKNENLIKKSIDKSLEKYLADGEKSQKSRLLNEFINLKVSPVEVEEIFKYRKNFPVTDKTTAKELVQEKQNFIASTISDLINKDEKLKNAIKITSHIMSFDSNIPSTSNSYSKLSTKKYSNLPRSIEVNKKGDVFVLFNKVKRGDRLLEGGEPFKKTKEAILLSPEGNKKLVRLREKKESSKKDQKEIETHRNLLSLAEQESKEGFFPEIYHVTTKDKRTAVIVEKFDEDLFHSLNPLDGEAKIPLTLEDKIFIGKRLLEIIKFLHDNQYLNRNITTRDLLIKRDENGRVNRVAMGDIREICLKSDKKHSNWGTPFYCSPELVRAITDGSALPYSEKSDNWAIGLTLFQLFKEDIPEWEKSSFELPFEKYRYKDREKLFKILAQLEAGWLPESSHPIAKIIVGLLHPDPMQRLSTDDAFNAFNIA